MIAKFFKDGEICYCRDYQNSAVGDIEFSHLFPTKVSIEEKSGSPSLSELIEEFDEHKGFCVRNNSTSGEIVQSCLGVAYAGVFVITKQFVAYFYTSETKNRIVRYSKATVNCTLAKLLPTSYEADYLAQMTHVLPERYTVVNGNYISYNSATGQSGSLVGLLDAKVAIIKQKQIVAAFGFDNASFGVDLWPSDTNGVMKQFCCGDLLNSSPLEIPQDRGVIFDDTIKSQAVQALLNISKGKSINSDAITWCNTYLTPDNALEKVEGKFYLLSACSSFVKNGVFTFEGQEVQLQEVVFTFSDIKSGCLDNYINGCAVENCASFFKGDTRDLDLILDRFDRYYRESLANLCEMVDASLATLYNPDSFKSAIKSACEVISVDLPSLKPDDYLRFGTTIKDFFSCDFGESGVITFDPSPCINLRSLQRPYFDTTGFHTGNLADFSNLLTLKVIAEIDSLSVKAPDGSDSDGFREFERQLLQAGAIDSFLDAERNSMRIPVLKSETEIREEVTNAVRDKVTSSINAKMSTLKSKIAKILDPNNIEVTVAKWNNKWYAPGSKSRCEKSTHKDKKSYLYRDEVSILGIFTHYEYGPAFPFMTPRDVYALPEDMIFEVPGGEVKEIDGSLTINGGSFTMKINGSPSNWVNRKAPTIKVTTQNKGIKNGKLSVEITTELTIVDYPLPIVNYKSDGDSYNYNIMASIVSLAEKEGFVFLQGGVEPQLIAPSHKKAKVWYAANHEKTNGCPLSDDYGNDFKCVPGLRYSFKQVSEIEVDIANTVNAALYNQNTSELQNHRADVLNALQNQMGPYLNKLFEGSQALASFASAKKVIKDLISWFDAHGIKGDNIAKVMKCAVELDDGTIVTSTCASSFASFTGVHAIEGLKRLSSMLKNGNPDGEEDYLQLVDEADRKKATQILDGLTEITSKPIDDSFKLFHTSDIDSESAMKDLNALGVIGGI